MTEESLAARAAAGDAAAFEALVRAHQSQLRAFLLRLTRGDAALADDLAQEAFLEAWRKIGAFRGDGPFAGWLLRIAWTRFLMEARRRKLEPFSADWEATAPADTPDLRLDLEAGMRRLSAAERASLTLCYAMGYSHEEAAAILAMPLGTVKSHVLRGREKLMALLGDRQ
jgi:RNA polymerase sigma-70 factor (ECF subfamily)